MRTTFSFFVLLVGIFLMSVSVGCNDQSITSYTAPHSAIVVEPSDGSLFIQGDEVVMTGRIDYSGGRVGRQIVASWTSNLESNQLGSRSFDEEEALVYTMSMELSVGVHLLTFTVQIDELEPVTGTVTVTVTENTSPAVSITSPTTSGIYNASEVVTLDILASDEESSQDELTVTWTTSLSVEPIVSNLQVQSNGRAPFPIDTLVEGEHILTATVQDPQGFVGTDQVTIHVLPPNAQPMCSINTPATGVSLEVDVTNTFVVQITATDPDGDNTELSATLSGNATVFGIQNPSPAGNASFQVIALPSGVHAIDLEVVDPRGGVCTDSIIINVSTRPTVTITSPTTGLVFTQGQNVTFSAQVMDVEDALPTLNIQWLSDMDGVLDTTASNPFGLVTFSVSNLTSGTHTVTLSVQDSSGLDAMDTLQVVINQPPTILFIQPTASLFTEGDSVLFQLSVADAGIMDLSTLDIEMSSNLDGMLVFGGHALSTGIFTINLPNLSVGSQVVTATVTDAFGAQGTATGVFTMNAIPAVTITSPLDEEVFPSGSTVTFGAIVSDPEDQVAGLMGSISVSWVSDRDGVLNTSSPTFDGTNWAMNFAESGLTEAVHTLTIEVVDSYGAMGSDEITFMLNEPPTVPTVELTPFFPTTTVPLTVSVTVPSIDPEGGSVTYDYMWTVDGVPAPTFNGLTQITSSATSHFEIWQVMVTATDDVGNTVSTVSNVVSIENSPPTPSMIGETDPELDFVEIQEGDVLSCNVRPFTDADGDAVSVSYVWYVNGIPISASTSSIDGTAFNKDDLIDCEVIYNDGFDTAGPYQSSNQTLVVNTPPTTPTVEIMPSNPGPSDPLVCTVTVPSVDPDPADTVLYRYEWYLAGILQSEVSSTISSTLMDSGQTWACQATPYDNDDDGVTSALSSVIVGGCLWTGPVSVTNSSANGTWICNALTGLGFEADGIEMGMRNESGVPEFAVFAGEFFGASVRANFGAVDTSMQLRLRATAINDPMLQVCGDTCNGSNCNTTAELLVFVSVQNLSSAFTYFGRYTIPFGSYLDTVIDFTGTPVQYVQIAVSGTLGPNDPNLLVDLLAQCQ